MTGNRVCDSPNSKIIIGFWFVHHWPNFLVRIAIYLLENASFSTEMGYAWLLFALSEDLKACLIVGHSPRRSSSHWSTWRNCRQRGTPERCAIGIPGGRSSYGIWRKPMCTSRAYRMGSIGLMGAEGATICLKVLSMLFLPSAPQETLQKNIIKLRRSCPNA